MYFCGLFKRKINKSNSLNLLIMSKNNNEDQLFSEFPDISTPQWEEKIMQDLKGGDYEKKLIWKTIDGLKIKPYYRQENLTNLEHLKSLPQHFPFVRGTKTNGNDWEIRQEVDIKSVIEANKIALEAIKRGANAIGFNAHYIETPDDIRQILKGIDINTTSIHFFGATSYPSFLDLLIQELQNQNVEIKKLKGSINFDPISFCLLHGNFYKSKNADFDECAEVLKTTKSHLPNISTITINGHYYHNAGASIVQELAYSLASANEYLAEMTNRGISIDSISSKMLFSFAIGSNYFMEIAKLRAARLLWAKIVEQYKPQNIASASMNIHAITSFWNKTIYDPYVNVLRSTTETMAASLGGANSITVLPFDLTYKKPDDFSNRVARNTQIILKEEAYFSKVADIAGGSYYIENLTDSIANAAWKLFQSIEEKGGLIEQITNGSIYEEIEKTCQQRDMDIAMRKTVMLGTNQHANQKETMLDKLQPNKDIKDLTSKLKTYRGATAFEALRMATEDFVLKGNKKPIVFLMTIGNLTMRKARAMFANNFFGCAGYDIIDTNGFQTVEEGAKEAFNANADIIVICSSDDEYAEIVPKSCKQIKERNNNIKVIVAGYPTAIIDNLKQAGVDAFIHIRTNVLETLQKFNHLLGI